MKKVTLTPKQRMSKALERFMKRHGETKDGLAKRAGCTYRYINTMLEAHSGPSIDLLVKIVGNKESLATFFENF